MKHYICPHCNIEMVIGIAIDPKHNGNDRCVCSGFGGGSRTLKHDEVEIIPVYKCPACGHSDDGATH